MGRSIFSVSLNFSRKKLAFPLCFDFTNTVAIQKNDIRTQIVTPFSNENVTIWGPFLGQKRFREKYIDFLSEDLESRVSRRLRFSPAFSLKAKFFVFYDSSVTPESYLRIFNQKSTINTKKNQIINKTSYSNT